ncbi:helix-turn-helix domain-containing protein [Xanthobacter sp. KR7-225]|uniref:helix-turn-helix domain-containing protein n=1 Tax=Xanthobacter sp. KR7-225 TaxID=3156613 RepID=UPI0032B3C82B
MVSASTGVSVDDILARRRAPAAAASARQLAMYLAHVGFGVALADVARAFRRDRTTVAYACRRIEDLRDGPFDLEVARLEACARWAAEG